ncbi:MAG TPA: hypothetical protein VF203_13640 [Burkholderiales bacterium]
MDAARPLWRGERIVRGSCAARARRARAVVVRRSACAQFGAARVRVASPVPTVVIVHRIRAGKTAS